tara:strand:+ start:1076 stop:1435 length:360 start_codon:yes stop_codon:yes gene_type:complete
MNSIKYSEGSEIIHNLNEDEFSKKNIVSKKEKNLLASTYLLLKICLFLLAFISLIKIGNITQLRISRLKEIKNSYVYEKDRFQELTNRFDNLLSQQGQQSFMKDQEQMISRDVMRVIWR